MKFLLLAFCMGVFCFSVVEASPQTGKEEARLQGLYHQFHCMVCAGQSLAESDAKLAINMRAKIRKLVAEGKKDAEIKEYFVARYSEDILMRPPVSGHTLPLWLAPGLCALAGLAFAGIYIRRHRG